MTELMNLTDEQLNALASAPDEDGGFSILDVLAGAAGGALGGVTRGPHGMLGGAVRGGLEGAGVNIPTIGDFLPGRSGGNGDQPSVPGFPGAGPGYGGSMPGGFPTNPGYGGMDPSAARAQQWVDQVSAQLLPVLMQSPALWRVLRDQIGLRLNGHEPLTPACARAMADQLPKAIKDAVYQYSCGFSAPVGLSKQGEETFAALKIAASGHIGEKKSGCGCG